MSSVLRTTAALLIPGLFGSGLAETIQGRVVEDHSGTPLVSADVRIFRVGARAMVADLETDGDGRFHPPGLSPADYRIEVSKPNYITTSVSLREPDSRRTLLIRLVRCGVISGHVTDAQGQPIRGAMIFAMQKISDGVVFRPFAGNHPLVDERGLYRLYGLPPGRYAIAVSYGASTAAVGSTGSAAASANVGSGLRFYPDSAQPHLFTISGGEDLRDVDFTIAPGALYSVSGHVELPEPKAEFWLALTSPAMPALATAVTLTEGDGDFRFTGIPAGTYYLFASGPATGRGGAGAVLGQEPFFGRNQVEVMHDVENISISVQKGRSVAFVLRSAGSQPPGTCPSTARISLSPLEDWAAGLDHSSEVTLAKEHIFDKLAPARYHVVVTELGDACYSVGNVILDLGKAAVSRQIAVFIASAGSIRGRLSAANSPPRDFAIVLGADDADGTKPVQIALPDAQSCFSFGGLRPGRYLIAVQPAEEAATSRWVLDPKRMFEIEVAAGAPTDLELPAPPVSKSQ